MKLLEFELKDGRKVFLNPLTITHIAINTSDDTIDVGLIGGHVLALTCSWSTFKFRMGMMQ